MSADAVEELVVLLDEDGRAIGTMPKAVVHDPDTPLHLAFSCYLFDHDGRLLLTQRALCQADLAGCVDQQRLRPPRARRADGGRRTPTRARRGRRARAAGRACCSRRSATAP